MFSWQSSGGTASCWDWNWWQAEILFSFLFSAAWEILLKIHYLTRTITVKTFKFIDCKQIMMEWNIPHSVSKCSGFLSNVQWWKYEQSFLKSPIFKTTLKMYCFWWKCLPLSGMPEQHDMIFLFLVVSTVTPWEIPVESNCMEGNLTRATCRVV